MYVKKSDTGGKTRQKCIRDPKFCQPYQFAFQTHANANHQSGLTTEQVRSYTCYLISFRNTVEPGERLSECFIIQGDRLMHVSINTVQGIRSPVLIRSEV